MNITKSTAAAPWLVLVFTLPSGKASERVQIWRKLQKLGAVPFRNAGYISPNTPENQERLVWIGAAVRDHDGEASVLEVQTVSDLRESALQEIFREARTPDFIALIDDMHKIKTTPLPPVQLVRFRRRLDEIAAIDFFANPLRKKAEDILARLERPRNEKDMATRRREAKKEYQNKTWMTRPRPGIDPVSSAWLISRFIDAKPKFIFSDDPLLQPKAIPFDMYGDRGFAHQGDNCTFETLCHAFGLTDKKVLLIAQSIHDADLEDAKFGRPEGHTINQILKGWAKQNLSDNELLRRGIDLIEGLYQSIQ